MAAKSAAKADELDFTFDFNPELQYAIYLDWALAYKRRNLVSKATVCVNEAVELRKDDPRPLILLSQLKLMVPNCQEALNTVLEALQMDPNSYAAKLQVMACIFHSDSFEECLKYVYTTKFKRGNLQESKNYLDYSVEVMEQTIGVEAGRCLFNLRNIIEKLIKEDSLISNDIRPMWKILRERGECDVLSDRVIEERILPPMSVKRRELNFTITNLKYFDASTHYTFNFLRELLRDPRVKLVQARENTENILKIINTDCAKVALFKKMLQSRSPMYTKRFAMIKNEKKLDEYKESTLFKVQNINRREAFNQLKHIKDLYRNGKLAKLLKYVENIMTNFYSTKSTRVMPRRFEFLSEIYSIVGLAYLKSFQVPVDLMQRERSERLCYLLGLPTDSKNKIIPQKKKFGDKSAFVDPESQGYEIYTKKTNHLQSRSAFIKYPIENCYISHEIALLHLAQHKLDGTQVVAGHVIESAKQACNIVWEFLGNRLNALRYLLQENLPKTKVELEKLSYIAEELDEDTEHFIKTALVIVENDIQYIQREEEERNKL